MQTFSFTGLLDEEILWLKMDSSALAFGLELLEQTFVLQTNGGSCEIGLKSAQ